ncbi:MAG: alpha/beta fold hydrolase [Acidimicrobiales bacterium]
MSSYVDLPNLSVSGENGVEYAYRDTGGTGTPLVLFQHFRGNLDNWDPALIDALSTGRRVVTFDNVGVASSTGDTPNTIAAMAQGALAFVDALELDRIDLLGFSIGSFVAQEITLARPGLVNRVVVASAAPQGAQGMHGWAKDVIQAVGQPEPNADGYLEVFFTRSEASRAAGVAALGRIFGPRKEPDAPTTWATRLAQYDAVCTWGVPNHGLLQRLEAIESAVFIANGDSDPMILPRYSYLLAGLIKNSQLKIYPDAAHGFLFQHHEAFAADVRVFLDSAD